MPVAAPNTSEVDEPAADSASRYVRGAETFIDSTSSLRIEEEIDIAYPRLSFELRKTGKPGYMASASRAFSRFATSISCSTTSSCRRCCSARRIRSSMAGLTASSAGLRQAG